MEGQAFRQWSCLQILTALHHISLGHSYKSERILTSQKVFLWSWSCHSLCLYVLFIAISVVDALQQPQENPPISLDRADFNKTKSSQTGTIVGDWILEPSRKICTCTDTRFPNVTLLLNANKSNWCLNCFHEHTFSAVGFRGKHPYIHLLRPSTLPLCHWVYQLQTLRSKSECQWFPVHIHLST